MSTINYTYNVIVDRFRQFSDGHFQLRRFTHGEISQADLEKEAEWPWMHVKPRAINYSPGTRAFSFEIFISDLPRDKEDKTGYQAESITDCSLIFQDLINEIHLGHMFGDDVVLTRPVNSEPFVEQYTHTLTGVTGIIELSLDYDWSACSIPASWNYNTPTDSPNDGFGALQFIESLDQNGAFVSLLNDQEAPGNSYYYGTNASGVKGWYAIVDNIGLTCETLPDCAVIISIEDDIAALQTDVALKANTADLGATAFSNDYADLDNKPTIPTTLPPSGAAGGDLTGTYPNPTVHRVHGVDFQSGAPAVDDTWIYVSTPLGPQPFQWQHSKLKTSQVQNDSTVTGTNADDALEHLDSSKVPTTRTISTTAPLSGGGDLSANRTLSIAQANTSTNGFLSSTDWNTFNAKQNALGYTPLAGVHSIVPMVSGDVTFNGLTAINANINQTNSSIRLTPYIPAQSITTSNLYINVTTATAGSLCTIVIYSDTNGVPTNRLYESADLDCSTLGLKTATTSFSFVAGTIYWLGIKTNAIGSTRVSLNTSSSLPLGASVASTFISYQKSAITYASPAPNPLGAVVLNASGGMIVYITKA